MTQTLGRLSSSQLALAKRPKFVLQTSAASLSLEPTLTRIHRVPHRIHVVVRSSKDDGSGMWNLTVTETKTSSLT